jgi:hypothetical protein
VTGDGAREAVRVRCELARQRKGEVVEDPGVAIEARDLPTVVSVRVPGDLAAALREVANARGVSVSDLLRGAAQRLVGKPAIGYQCDHMNITSLPGLLGKVTAWCGCDMQLVYSTRELRPAPSGVTG